MNRIKNLYLFWLARRLPTCKEILPDISRAMDQKLSFRKWIVLKLHLHVCEMCLRYEKQLEALRSAVKEQTKQVESSSEGLSSEARERLKRVIRG